MNRWIYRLCLAIVFWSTYRDLGNGEWRGFFDGLILGWIAAIAAIRVKINTELRHQARDYYENALR